MENTYNIIRENVDRIRYEIGDTCAKIGRNAEEVMLMGVSKTKTAQDVEAAIKAGITLFGENRVQELQQKAEMFQKYNVPCHIIGQLQTNKVKYLPPLTGCIQSVDSVKLAKEIDKQYTKHGSVADVLVEVNIGYEDSKSGIDIVNAYEFIHEISEFEGLHVKGLMCVPPICEGDMVRKYFAQMYQLFVDIQSKNVDNVNMDILSMGMSDDFKYAIMEGSNLVRVGSSIFGKRNYNV
ncbi:MAG: YggS family pyridoxal phosphate-dependent enzyme [Oscillospiraceae bacterium]|nr:YggS family pyridoxal phosphate-dependent enzyme [Oscillospiraceae bacterium]